MLSGSYGRRLFTPGSGAWGRILSRAAALLTVSLLGGCAAVYEPGVTVQPAARILGPVGEPGAAATVQAQALPEYRINPGDQLSIRFPRRPAYSDIFVVRVDGRIIVPQIGSVVAASRTVDELQAELVERYRKLVTALPPAAERSYLLQPNDVLDIHFSFFPDLNSVVSVRADGRISLPMVGDMIAEGLTPTDLQSRLRESFARRIANPELVVMVREARSNIYFHQGQARVLPDPGMVDLAVNLTRTVPLVVYVGGEVPAPGVHQFVGGSGALQTIFTAGGPMSTGDMRSVVILRRGADDKVIRIVTDLTQDLAGNGTNDIVVQPFDVVVVPRSSIAQVGDALDQYIYRVVRPLANSTVGFYFTRQVGTVRQQTEITP